MTAQQWDDLVHAKTNDPRLDPVTAPTRQNPGWEKFWTLHYSLAGASRPKSARRPPAGAMEGGGDPATDT